MKIIKLLTQVIMLGFYLLIIPAISYADMPFDPDNTQFLDPSDTNNIGYYLNNDFYSSLAQKELIEIKSWDIKFNDGTGSQSNVNAKIALISYAEHSTYSSLFPSNGNGYSWWTRTPFNGVSTLVVYVNSAGGFSSGQALVSHGVRPVLYLKSGLMVSSTKKIQETGGTPLHSETPGTIIKFSGVDWKILDQIADGTTYIILNDKTDNVIIPQPPPDEPTGLYADNITTTSARATWTSVTGATSYNVYLDGVKIGSVSSTEEAIAGLQPSTTYQVAVSAVNSNGEGSQCAPVSFTTLEDLGGGDPPDDPIWTPLPGPGMGFTSDTGSVFDTMKLFFSMFKGSIWPFILTFLALFTAGLLWKIWRRATR